MWKPLYWNRSWKRWIVTLSTLSDGCSCDLASTSTVAVNVGGTTVHSLFKLMQQLLPIVKCVIINKINMIGSNTFHSVKTWLQEVTANYTDGFGILHVIQNEHFKQLLLVKASSIYKENRSLVPLHYGSHSINSWLFRLCVKVIFNSQQSLKNQWQTKIDGWS